MAKKLEKKSTTQICPCLPACPLETTMRLLGGHWKIPILCALEKDGCTRYNELKRKIRGITNTMLVTSLKELEEAGLVCRKEYLEIPVRVEYELTTASTKLLPIVNSLVNWSLQQVE